MERAAAGEEFLVTRRGKPYVRLVPAMPRLPVRGDANLVPRVSLGDLELSHAQPTDLELLDREALYGAAADRQAADRQAADRQAADRGGPDRERSQGERAGPARAHLSCPDG